MPAGAPPCWCWQVHSLLAKRAGAAASPQPRPRSPAHTRRRRRLGRQAAQRACDGGWAQTGWPALRGVKGAKLGASMCPSTDSHPPTGSAARTLGRGPRPRCSCLAGRRLLCSWTCQPRTPAQEGGAGLTAACTAMLLRGQAGRQAVSGRGAGCAGRQQLQRTAAASEAGTSPQRPGLSPSHSWPSAGKAPASPQVPGMGPAGRKCGVGGRSSGQGRGWGKAVACCCHASVAMPCTHSKAAHL